MPSKVKIESLGVYLPPKVLTTEELMQRCLSRPRLDLEKVTGIHERRVAEGEYAKDLGIKAAERALAMSRYAAEDLDVVVCTSISKHHAPDEFSFEPATALLVRKAIGARRALVFDVVNACAGMLNGVYVVQGLIRAGLARRGLVVSGEQNMPLAETATREVAHSFDRQLAALTLGDCGAALVLDAATDPSVGFHWLDLVTGAKHDHYCYSRPSRRGRGGALMTKARGLQIKGAEHFPFYLKQALDATGWTLDYFGAMVFAALSKAEVHIARVVAPAADDRLALAAKAAGVAVHVLADPKTVPKDAIADETDLIVAAHTHARVSNEALARSRLGGIGYHPSLLPRHRGIAAVEWTILCGDPIAGGSVYHLADGWDAGAIAAQDWCFVAKDETARELWERALAPMGLELLTRVVQHAAKHGALPARMQDERFATRAPKIRATVSLTDESKPALASLVVTAIARDRPGLVRLLSDRARGFGANWAGSRMASLAGQFAGMVHFEVPAENADALAAALRGLEPSGVRVVIERSDAPPTPAGRRVVALELVGPDRPGIVRDLSSALADRGVSIEELHTEIVNGTGSAPHRFNVKALLVVPDALANDDLKRGLDALANEMSVDIALGERPNGDRSR